MGGLSKTEFLNSAFGPYSKVPAQSNSVTVSKPVGYDEVTQTPHLLERTQTLNAHVTLVSKAPPTANGPQLDSMLAAFLTHLNSICQTFALTLFSHTNVLGGF
jgi:hypothetical protein